MLRVLLVVPYPKLEEAAKKIYTRHFERRDIHMDIRVIKAEEIEEKLWNETYDLIIGRGHTAAVLLKREPYVPVLEIPITGYDVCRSLLLAKEKFGPGKTAVIVSSSYNHDEQLLGLLAQMDVTVREVSDFNRVGEAVREAVEQGYRTVIGGYSVTSAASKQGVNAITIETGEEAIIQIMHEAVRMIDTICQEREQRNTYETITQSSKEGIIYVDSRGEVRLANKKILQMILTEHASVHGRKLEAVYPFFAKRYKEVIGSGNPLYNELQDVEKKTLSVDYVPVLVGQKTVGVVITCQTVKKIQQIESQIRKKLSEKGLVANYTFADAIRKSELMEKTVAIAGKYAQVDSNILIVGETGTGKEVIAQSIHNASGRRNGPFVAVNCAALPENLLESELFGYVDGAFTGSRRGGKMGFFEQAHRGTLFLDEISEIPINFQGKLLRVLQERQVRRIGDDKVIDVDVRIIAATNKNLWQMVLEKEFRQDLLYRVDVLEICIPPLRERKEDIMPLFYGFLKEYNNRFGKDIAGCTKRAGELLIHYPYKGNIRELRNIAERVAVMCEEKEIDDHLMEAALYPEDVFSSRSGFYGRMRPEKEETLEERETSERERIAEALMKTGGRKGAAAELLGMDRSTLWRKMKLYEIE